MKHHNDGFIDCNQLTDCRLTVSLEDTYKIIFVKQITLDFFPLIWNIHTWRVCRCCQMRDAQNVMLRRDQSNITFIVHSRVGWNVMGEDMDMNRRQNSALGVFGKCWVWTPILTGNFLSEIKISTGNMFALFGLIEKLIHHATFGRTPAAHPEGIWQLRRPDFNYRRLSRAPRSVGLCNYVFYESRVRSTLGCDWRLRNLPIRGWFFQWLYWAHKWWSACNGMVGRRFTEFLETETNVSEYSESLLWVIKVGSIVFLVPFISSALPFSTGLRSTALCYKSRFHYLFLLFFISGALITLSTPENVL